jgi:threonine dehydrogenase-like Zn-dependent dehydrogenase
MCGRGLWNKSSMRALAINELGELNLRDMPEPEPGPGEVLIRTKAVGICATDREMVRSKTIFTVPDGQKDLILGHEGLGSVVALGEGVAGLIPGESMVPVAYIDEHRHSVAGLEIPCRIDMCPFGHERRRGINADGFFRDYFVDRPNQLVSVPSEISDVAMLLEPLTVTLKGLTDAHVVRQRWLEGSSALTPDEFPQKTLVVGAGPIGLLGILLSRVYGWETVAVDVVDADSKKAQIVKQAGAHYINARETSPQDIRANFKEFDIIVEAVQDPRILFDYVDLLAMNGVFLVVGWVAGVREDSLDMASFIRELLTKHATVLATVGGGRRHYQEGMRRLVEMKRSFGDVLEQMVTARYPIEQYETGLAIAGPQEIKTVLEFK